MDSRRQHHGMQQFPPLLQSQGGGHPRQHLPLPPPHLAIGGPRPSPFSGGPAPPLSGHKRNSAALYNRSADGPNFARLFVGSLPRNISEDEVRDLFGDFGNVVEVSFLKDKKTGLNQGCCFIKFSSVMEAERAVRALDNQRSLPGSSEPLQVKFADGDRDHPGLHEHKLFVGSVSRQANEQEIEEIFAPYGRVENVYVIRNEQRQSRGCAFVSFPEREMAIGAISALDGVYRMAGCHQPLIVRFADPKRPRSGEPRMGNQGTNYSPHSHQGSGAPRGSGGQSFRGHSPAYGWRQGGGPSGVGLLPQTGILPLGGRGAAPARGVPLDGSNASLDTRGGAGGAPASPIMSGQLAFSGTSPQLSQQQGINELSLQRPIQAFSHQLPLHQQTLQPNISSISHLNQMQPVQGIPLAQPSEKRVQQLVSSGQFSPAQQTTQAYGPLSVPHHQTQSQLVVTSMQQGLPTQQLSLQSLHPQNSQPIQQPIMMPSQQGHQQILPLQPLPPQPQQQVILKEQPLLSQLHQQVLPRETTQQAYMQPPQMTTQQPGAGNVQGSWSLPVQQHVITSQAAPPAVTPPPVLATCDWTEHTSPEGHKYYYNSSTGESRWEKPEEFAAFEKQKLLQQQQQLQQQPHVHQQQEVQAQAQPHVQQLLPQMLNQQYQQQQPQLVNQQPQQTLQQPYSQNLQPYQQQQHAHMQQVPQQQLQLQHHQLPQQQSQQQPLAQQHQAPVLQQTQREAQLPSAGVPSMLQHYGQSTSGGPYQPFQAYAHMQPQMHQQLPNQQVLTQAPSANGAPDLARGVQWLPAAQQAVPNQEWMLKLKPSGS